ncbi:MAG: gamma-glutamylcyclotransferase [Bacteroidetes bacterium]|nr:gamma-glutamylcyclotransferase [Bacteroidota bacterium]
MERKDYLFVYGTLRRNYNLKLKDKVAASIKYVGQGKVAASLYDIGKYPGARKENSADEVVGDVFVVDDPEKVFKVLDKYEGNEFVREKNRVKLRSGKSLNAWIYWYGQKPVGKKRIPYKDYFNYLKSKKTA